MVFYLAKNFPLVPEKERKQYYYDIQVFINNNNNNNNNNNDNNNNNNNNNNDTMQDFYCGKLNGRHKQNRFQEKGLVLKSPLINSCIPS